MSRDSFKEATLSGVRWVMLTRIASETVALGSTVALARLLAPAQFAHAAVALIFIPLATILTFEGFASALVQRETIEEEHVRAAVSMSLLGGLILSAIAAALAPLLWRALFGEQTAEMMLLMSPVFLVASIGGVSRALLWRRLEFRRMNLIEMGALTLGSLVALALALEGLGARANVIGALAQVALGSLLLLAAAPTRCPAGTCAPAGNQRLRRARGAGGARGRAVPQRRLRDPRGAPLGHHDRHLLPRLQPRRRLPGQAQRRHGPGRLPRLLTHREPRRAAPAARARDARARGGHLPPARLADRVRARTDPVRARTSLGGLDRADADPGRRGHGRNPTGYPR